MLSGSPGPGKQPSNLPSPRLFFSSTDKLEFLLYSDSGMAFVLRNIAIWWYLFAMPTCGLPLLSLRPDLLIQYSQTRYLLGPCVLGTVLGAGIQQGTRTLTPWS